MLDLQEKTFRLLREEIPRVTDAIRRIMRKLDTGEEWETHQKVIAFMAVQKLSSDETNIDTTEVMKSLYGMFRKALFQRIEDRAFPSLEKLHGMVFVRELLRQWAYYVELSQNLIFLFRPMETKGLLLNIIPSSLKQISVLCFCVPIWTKFFPIIDQALLDKVGSGALIEGRPNDRDANLIKKMLRFFANMYRMYSDPGKYMNHVVMGKTRNQQQATGGS